MRVVMLPFIIGPVLALASSLTLVGQPDPSSFVGGPEHHRQPGNEFSFSHFQELRKMLTNAQQQLDYPLLPRTTEDDPKERVPMRNQLVDEATAGKWKLSLDDGDLDRLNGLRRQADALVAQERSPTRFGSFGDDENDEDRGRELLKQQRDDEQLDSASFLGTKSQNSAAVVDSEKVVHLEKKPKAARPSFQDKFKKISKKFHAKKVSPRLTTDRQVSYISF
jgi:hypothetical protein